MSARSPVKKGNAGNDAPPTAPAAAPAALTEAWRVMHFALRAVIAEPDRILATRGLTRVHHRILFFVAHSPGMSVGELQTTLDVTKQALNAPLRQLQAQGLIELSKADHDARVRQMRLTADGAALEAKLTGEQYRLFADAFAQAGPQAHAGWRVVMHALAKHVDGQRIDNQSGRP